MDAETNEKCELRCDTQTVNKTLENMKSVYGDNYASWTQMCTLH